MMYAPAVNILTIAMGITLCFWGLQLTRIVSSIAFAVFLGYIAYIYAHSVLHNPVLSSILTVSAVLIGFGLGFIMFRFAISLMFSYAIASIVTSNVYLVMALTIVLTAIVYILSRYLLSLIISSTGSIIIYKSLIALGLSQILAIVLAIVIGIIGLVNQLKRERL
ncbi:MAG: hypothetical protein QXR37_07050 [Ignisphaera sp.]